MKKMKKTKKTHGLCLAAALLAVCLLVAAYPMLGIAEAEAISPDVTSKVVSQDANQAGIFFLATPEDDPAYADAIAAGKADGITWSTTLAVIEGSSTAAVAGRDYQLAAEGSGFTFRLNVNEDGKGGELRPAIGFNANIYFTAEEDNLGAETFDALVTALETAPRYEDWALPDSTVLTRLGIGVYTEYQGETLDITDRASYGINMAEAADGRLLFSYGAVMVDREITDISNEGYPLAVSDEEELIWSDGTADNIITAVWWIGKTAPSDVWLASYANPFLGTWVSEIPSANATLTFTFGPDATFDYILSGVPADQGGEGSGGYIVRDDTMVSFLAFEGAAMYRFTVVDNSTINVTEIVDVVDGNVVLGETAPFIRAAGSSVLDADLPFVLENPFIGTFEADIPDDENPGVVYAVIMEYTADGYGVFTIKPDMVFPPATYFVSDNYLITYSPEEAAYEVFSFEVISDSEIAVTEALSFSEDGTVEYGITAPFYRVP